MVPSNGILNQAMAEALGYGLVGQYREFDVTFSSYKDGSTHTVKATWRPDFATNLHKGEVLTNPGNRTRLMHWARGEAKDVPEFTEYRDNLPEVWEAVEKAGQETSFGQEVVCMRLPCGSTHYPFLLATADAKFHVIAALKALGKWKPEWEVGEAK